MNCLELHEDVYKSELTRAIEMPTCSRRLAIAQLGNNIPMASGNPIIDGETEEVRPRDPDTGEILEPGLSKYADQQFLQVRTCSVLAKQQRSKNSFPQ